MSKAEFPVKVAPVVCYIGGIGRSGSTILDLLLSQSDSVVGTGQVAGLGLDVEKSCSCGSLIRECEFWSHVIRELGPEGLKEWRSCHELIFRERYYWRFLSSKRLCDRLAGISDIAFRRIDNASRPQVIVDSSKNLSRAMALIRSSKFAVRFVHLTRDSRGYINSVNNYRVGSGHPARLAVPMAEWVVKNSMASMVARMLPPEHRIRVRYEDLTTRPIETLRKLQDWLQVDLSKSVDAVERGVALKGFHLFSGNRLLANQEIRFQQKEITKCELKHFDGWYHSLCGGFLGRIWGYP